MNALFDPAILFFVFGLFAGLVKSDLEIPAPIARFLSLYLLMALGLKGGFALAESGLTMAVMASLIGAVLMALIAPAIGYLALRNRVSRYDAAAIAASYGSVSAVTFLTAAQYLEDFGMPAGGHMAVALVLMESPAILVAVLIANALRAAGTVSSTVAGGLAAAESLANRSAGQQIGKIIHESLTNGSHMLLIGALLVGIVSGDSGKAVMQPFSIDLFKGMLAFFLLDMGLTVARNFGDARRAPPLLMVYAVIAPLLHASIALGLALMLRLAAADAALLMVLSASASYIVVPAVMRQAIPEANPALYCGLSLGITFPLNLLVGIPLYSWAARWLLG
ncbi:MAG: sodium-dependent bicarbonate transport family permease [Betaproteobacteria bacterium]|nr:sodium-dependent bicarbonate transport family permease [Betaproteobacteria bacterium]